MALMLWSGQCHKYLNPDCVLQDLTDGLRTCVWEPLPEGWEQHHDASTGRPYFCNTNTGEKTWERPTISFMKASLFGIRVSVMRGRQ
jgi:hypothetical protein